MRSAARAVLPVPRVARPFQVRGECSSSNIILREPTAENGRLFGRVRAHLASYLADTPCHATLVHLPGSHPPSAGRRSPCGDPKNNRRKESRSSSRLFSRVARAFDLRAARVVRRRRASTVLDPPLLVRAPAPFRSSPSGDPHCATPRCAAPRRTVPRRAAPRHAMPCHAMPRRTPPRHAASARRGPAAGPLVASVS